MTNKEDIGKVRNLRNLRRIRENQQLSIRQLAQDLDVNYSLISYWETGKKFPRERNRVKLEKYFGVPSSELFKIDKHENSSLEE
ncbi:hypothetical protein [Listeria phage 20422-1]